MCSSNTALDWTDVSRQATTDDNSLPDDSAYHEFQTRLREASERFGRVMNISPQFRSFVVDAGFQNVNEELYKVPLSPWPADRRYRELGRYMNVQMMDSLEPYSLALFTRVLGWQPERLQELLARVRQDLRNPNYHMYSMVYVGPVATLHCLDAGKLTSLRQALRLWPEAHDVTGLRGCLSSWNWG